MKCFRTKSHVFSKLGSNVIYYFMLLERWLFVLYPTPKKSTMMFFVGWRICSVCFLESQEYRGTPPMPPRKQGLVRGSKRDYNGFCNNPLTRSYLQRGGEVEKRWLWGEGGCVLLDLFLRWCWTCVPRCWCIRNNATHKRAGIEPLTHTENTCAKM